MEDAMENYVIYATFDLRVKRAEEPGMVLFQGHRDSSMVSDAIGNNPLINELGQTLLEATADKLEKWPDEDFKKYKVELFKLLPPDTGHFEKGVWVQEKGE